MSAPLAAAHFIPAAMSGVDPLGPFITLTSSSCALQSSPVVPIELSATAPMSPAMNVPWLVSTELVGPKPHPATRRTRPTKSGCWSSIPVSTTAIVTSLLPVLSSHAAEASIALKCHGTPYGAHPVKHGSLGLETPKTSVESETARSRPAKALG